MLNVVQKRQFNLMKSSVHIRTSSGWYPEVVHRLMAEKQTTLTKCHNLNGMSTKVILYLRAKELSDGGAEDLPAISKP